MVFLTTINLISIWYYSFLSSFLKQYFLFFIFAPIFLYFNLKKISLTFNNPTFKFFSFIFFFFKFFVVLGHNPQNITACLIIPFVILFSEIIKTNKINKVKENLSKKTFLIIFPVYYFWSLIKFGPLFIISNSAIFVRIFPN